MGNQGMSVLTAAGEECNMQSRESATRPGKTDSCPLPKIRRHSPSKNINYNTTTLLEASSGTSLSFLYIISLHSFLPLTMSSPSGPSTTSPFPFLQEEEEHLEVSDRKDASSVWALKVPNFLLQRWQTVQEPGVELGRLVVDNSVTPPNITLKLTNAEEGTEEAERAKRAKYDVEGLPDEFKVEVPMERSKNTFLFSEVKKVYDKGGRDGRQQADAPRDAWGKRKREKAHPKLLARVDHEGHIQPIRTQKYLDFLKARRMEAEQSRRCVLYSTVWLKGKWLTLHSDLLFVWRILV